MSSPQKWYGSRLNTRTGTQINLGFTEEALKKASEYSGFSKFVENPRLFEGYT
jgi:hypothetical protein